MKFYRKLHQKVPYDGQLYVVLLDEFPEYHKEGKDYKVVIHPIANEWIYRSPIQRSPTYGYRGAKCY